MTLPPTAAQGEPLVGQLASAGHPARVALDAKVILTPPCTYPYCFSIQNIQGCVRMMSTSTPRLGMAGFVKLGVPAHRLILGMPWVGMVYPCLGLD